MRTRYTVVLLAALSGCGTNGSNGTQADGGGESAPLDVATTNGPVRGTANGNSRLFLGIPFAAPPVGELRFRPPAPAAKWTAPRDASATGPACPQINPQSQVFDPRSSEDCLTLNVWAPIHAAAPRAVMLFLHGGAFVTGSGGDATYDGQNLSEAGGVIVVTSNYRLGPLGFAASSALAAEDADHTSGNYGLRDQQMAMKWVQENIAAFGGDPGNVTIFGESAGGISVCLHLVMGSSRGLFQKAIIESGPCSMVAVPTRAVAEGQGAMLAATLGCNGDAASVRTCLRAKSPKEIMSALPQKKEYVFGDGVTWWPDVDGVLVADKPAALLGAKDANVPLLIGANADEGTLFVSLGSLFGGTDPIQTEADARSALASLFDASQIDKIAARYPFSPSAKQAAAKIVGDVFVCDTRRMARLHAAAGRATFEYHFTHPFKWLIPNLGAFHGAELPFVFQNPFALISITDAEQPLSKSMQGYWTRFAKTGDPNGADASGTAVTWPPYDATGDRHLTLDLTITAESGLRKDACDFWESLL